MLETFPCKSIMEEETSLALWTIIFNYVMESQFGIHREDGPAPYIIFKPPFYQHLENFWKHVRVANCLAWFYARLDWLEAYLTQDNRNVNGAKLSTS